MLRTRLKKSAVVTYCIAGSFVSGSRRDVAAVLEQMGNKVVEDISGQVDFLLIGTKTEAGNSTIDAALDFLYRGHRITLLHEGHWLEFVESDPEAFAILKSAKALDDASAFKRPASKAKDVLWEGAHMVRFRYRNAKGVESERDVRLQKVTAEADGSPAALVGYCTLRKMNRTFKAANVVSAEVIDVESGEVAELQALLARL